MREDVSEREETRLLSRSFSQHGRMAEDAIQSFPYSVRSFQLVNSLSDRTATFVIYSLETKTEATYSDVFCDVIIQEWTGINAYCAEAYLSFALSRGSEPPRCLFFAACCTLQTPNRCLLDSVGVDLMPAGRVDG